MPAERRLSLVTGLFDLARREASGRRSVDEYLRHARYVLSRPVDLVAHVDRELIGRVARIREEFDHGLARTRLIPTDLEELPWYGRLEEIRLARKRNPVRNANPEKDTPRYIALTWTKFQLLRSAVDANPFAATRLGWIDIGLAHVANTSVAAAGLAFDVVHVPDRVRLEILRPFTPAEVFAPDYFRHLHGIVALGYCTGDLDRLRQLCDLFDREVEAALAGGFAPSEEQIVPRIFAAHPHLFAPYDGDYHTILVNYAGMRAGVSKLVGDLRRAEALGEMAGAARLRSALQTSWGQRRIALSGAALALVLGRTS